MLTNIIFMLVYFSGLMSAIIGFRVFVFEKDRLFDKIGVLLITILSMSAFSLLSIKSIMGQ